MPWNGTAKIRRRQIIVGRLNYKRHSVEVLKSGILHLLNGLL